MSIYNYALAINIAGTILGVTGAILNATGSRAAFPIWITSNVLLFVLFFGIWRGWWRLNSGAALQCFLYVIYMGTSIFGYWRCYI
ncbi:MAG: hypothetical protein PHX61_02555 [Alphaproteobacteria bacterium]|nr:hypothetical protein [Alphaproteobacteria bacterium]